jgi:hypothetical protein
MVFMASVRELNCHTVPVQYIHMLRVVHALYGGLCEQHLQHFVYIKSIGISQISLYYYY